MHQDSTVAGDRAKWTKPHFSTRTIRSYIYVIDKMLTAEEASSFYSLLPLPKEYLSSEANWVSLEFQILFFSSIPARISPNDVARQAGWASVLEEFMGKSLALLLRYAFPLREVYRRMPIYFPMFNAVSNGTLKLDHVGRVVIEFRPRIETLSFAEIEIYRKLMPILVWNALGHLESFPQAVGGKSAVGGFVQSDSVSGVPVYELDIRYVTPRLNNIVQKIVGLILIGGASYLVLSKFLLSQANAVVYALGVVLAAYAANRFVRLRQVVKRMAEEHEVAMSSVNGQYKSLHETRVRLDRRMKELEVVEWLSRSFHQAEDAADVYSAVCSKLEGILNVQTALVAKFKSGQNLEIKYQYRGDMGAHTERLRAITLGEHSSGLVLRGSDHKWLREVGVLADQPNLWALSIFSSSEDAEFLVLGVPDENLVQSEVSPIFLEAVAKQTQIALAHLKVRKHREDLIKAREVEKMAQERNELTYKISRQVAHDIRSPLSALQLVCEKAEIADVGIESLLRTAVKRISEMATQLLAARNQIGDAKPGPVGAASVEKTVRDIVAEKNISQEARRRIAITVHLREGFVGDTKINAHLPTLARVVANILQNSIEATASDGEIEVLLASNISNVEVEIRDNGNGMTPEVLASAATEGFSHGKGHLQDAGTGLGLFHAKQTIQGWGGEFRLKSEAGKGSSVVLLLC